MGSGRIKSDRVVYSEGIFSKTIDNGDLGGFVGDIILLDPINAATVDVTLKTCDVVVDSVTHVITLENITFSIVKNITVNLDPSGTETKEFIFDTQALTDGITLGKLSNSFDYPTTATEQSKIRCEFYNVGVTDLLVSKDVHTLTETLILTFTVNLIMDDQMVVAFAPVTCRYTV